MDDDRRMTLPTADAGAGEMNTTNMTMNMTTTTMEDDRPGSIPLTSSTMALSRQLLPTEVCTLCPVLIGTYTVDENGAALWTGRWAMLEAEYANGITSLFEMKSKKGHVTLDGHGDNVTDEDENRASPSPALDEPPKDTVVMERSFDGFFQIQTLKGKPNTVPEKDVVLSFYKCSVDHAYLVRGNGENRFGAFTLQGVLDDATKVMRLYKAYKPKDKTPVAKRTRPKPAPASVTKAPALKKQKKALPGSTPMSEYNSSAPGTPDVELTHVIVPHTKLSSVISISSGNSSPLISSRNRSERKRVIPAHLRDDAGVDRDRAPVMRKCLSTLKTLMGNPKALPFLVPVDPVALGIPDYFNVIKDPMDLGTIRSNFEYGVYAEPEYFASHVRLVFKNAMLYNAPHTQVYVFAQKLLEDFEKKYKSMLKNESAAAKSRKHGNTSDGEGSVDSNRAKKSKRASLTKNQEIQSLKQEIEKMKVIVQEMASGKGTPPLGTPIGGNPIKTSKPRPFKMQDMTEEYLSRPMTATEKHKLTADLKELPEDKLSRVLQIISETVPLHTITQGDDEVELDINMFDTRCLRMIEGYVREQNIAKKRKRPAKRPSVKGASESRLQYAKEVAESVKSRHEQLKSQLAAIEGETYVPPQEVIVAPVPVPTIEHSSSGSSSDSSSSSDDDSDSSDSDTERPLQKSPPLVSASALTSSAEISSTVVEGDTEPLKVENHCAWTKLASMDATGLLPIQSNEHASSSLWLKAQAEEQQKLQKEQRKDSQSFADDIAQQKQKEMEARMREMEREREEAERKKAEEAAAEIAAREARLREQEKALASQRAQEREKLQRDIVVDLAPDTQFREDVAQFGTASFF